LPPTTSGLETKWDYSGRKGRDGQKKKIGKAKERKEKVKRGKDELFILEAVNRQKDRQTNAWVKHNLLGGGNYCRMEIIFRMKVSVVCLSLLSEHEYPQNTKPEITKSHTTTTTTTTKYTDTVTCTMQLQIKCTKHN